MLTSPWLPLFAILMVIFVGLPRPQMCVCAYVCVCVCVEYWLNTVLHSGYVKHVSIHLVIWASKSLKGNNGNVKTRLKILSDGERLPQQHSWSACWISEEQHRCLQSAHHELQPSTCKLILQCKIERMTRSVTQLVNNATASCKQ